MAADIPLGLQTAYAELLERSASVDFNEAFEAESGIFTPKTIRDRRYWYFQEATTRRQRYVGPETTELLDRIAQHKRVRDDRRERDTLVSTLVRSAHLPRPTAEAGKVLRALAQAGVFRLRGVLIGTIAFQTYAAMLGVRLTGSAIQTGDVDIAQDSAISVAVADETAKMLDVLKGVDPSFRPVPHLHDARRATTYASVPVRVDFLTPNRGPDTDTPAKLPALGTDAQRLRFLDYLIREPEPAVILYKAGIYVQVPAPQRYAIHKLIIAQRRQMGSAKREKDIRQAQMLLEVLLRKRRDELRRAWEEAFGRGKTWQRLLIDGLAMVGNVIRDETLLAVGLYRNALPKLDLRFDDDPARYDFARDVVMFDGRSGPDRVRCGISREALEDHFDAKGQEKEDRIRTFRENRSAIEAMARVKYLAWPIETAAAVLITSRDVPKLHAALDKPHKRAASRRRS
jgi:hypothetical protein